MHIGIVGGMGSVASAAFLQTLYDELHVTRELDFPVVTYLSDPAAPSRSTENEQALTTFIVQQVKRLFALGATDIAVCCMIAHSLDLPFSQGFHSLKQIVLSLLEESTHKPPLIVGSRLLFSDINVRYALFGNSMSHALPAAEDSARFFAIYDEVKTNHLSNDSLDFFRAFAERNADQSIILCCSEFHVLARAARTAFPANVLDPLTILARRLSAQNRGSASR